MDGQPDLAVRSLADQVDDFERSIIVGAAPTAAWGRCCNKRGPGHSKETSTTEFVDMRLCQDRFVKLSLKMNGSVIGEVGHLVVRGRRKIPSVQEPMAAAVRLPEPRHGYGLSASHH